MPAHQQQSVEGGMQLAMDGKPLRSTRLPDEEPAEHVLSVYDVQEERVIVQAAVGEK